MRLVTLLAVVDMGGELWRSTDDGGETSSTGDTRPADSAEALFFPKLSFHFDGFLVTGGGETVEIGETGGEGGAPRLVLRGPVSIAEGIGNIETGSNGSRTRREDPVVLGTDLLVDDDLEALLISRARD